MYRIIIMCLILVSLAAAVPNTREKRHFSFLRNLFRSAFFGSNQRESEQFTKTDPIPQYQIYQVPGFDDIFVRAMSAVPDIQETVLNEPGEVLKVQPFESYIGTKSPEDTLVAFQNVNNLLSTGILNGKDTNRLRDIMVPMISGLHLKPQENILPFPGISDISQPTQIDVVDEPYEEKALLRDRFQPRYSYQEVDSPMPVIDIAANDNPEIIIKEVDRPASIPACIDQRIEQLFTSGANSRRLSSKKTVVPIRNNKVTDDQHPDAVTGLPPSESDEPLKISLLQHYGQDSGENNITTLKNVSLKPSSASPTHFDEPAHSNYVKTPAAHSTTKRIDVSETLTPLPPQDISTVPTGSLNITEKEDKDTKTNDSNVVLSAKKDLADRIISRYINKQARRNNSDAASMATGSANQPKANTEPLSTRLPKIEKTERVEQNKDDVDKSPKVTEEVPEKGSLAYYIYQRENHSSPKPFSKVEADDPKSNDDTPEFIRYVYIPSDYNRLSEGTNSRGTAKNGEINREKSQYVYKQVNHNDANSFSMVKDGDQVINGRGHSILRTILAHENSAAAPQKSKFSFQDNPIAVHDGKYAYHQSNPDGSSVSVKGNKDGVSVNVSDKSSNNRGDIPEE